MSCCVVIFFGLLLFFDMDTAESPRGSSDSRRESEQGVNADWVEVETVNVSSTEIQKSRISFSTQMALNTGAHVQPATHQSFITSCVFCLAYSQWVYPDCLIPNLLLQCSLPRGCFRDETGCWLLMEGAMLYFQTSNNSQPKACESELTFKPWSVCLLFQRACACALVHWNNAKWCGYEGNVCQNCWVHFNYGEGLCNPPDWPDIIQK